MLNTTRAKVIEGRGVMGETKIPYADKACNAVVGCTHSGMPGCDHCWARELHDMRHRAFLTGKKVPKQYAKPFSEVQLLPERIEEPLHWRKPRTSFWCSTSDIFHKDVPDEFIWQMIRRMDFTSWHTHLILTKRIERAAKLLTPDNLLIETGRPELHQSILTGCSCSTQDDLNKMLPHLLQIPGRHWLSLEPLLEEIDLSYNGVGITCPECKGKGYITNRKHWMHSSNTGDDTGQNWCTDCNNLTSGINPIIAGIDWVVVGCESGSKRRPCDIEWVRSVVRQCERPEVPVYVKQLEINGKVVTKLKDFPPDLRIQEQPK